MKQDDEPLLLKLSANNPYLAPKDLTNTEEEQGGTGAAKPQGADLPVGFFAETDELAHAQRKEEQTGHRRYAKVHARDKSKRLAGGNEPQLDQGIKQHPYLDNQRFDGVDSNLNPAPPDNPAALAEFENERAEQEKQKQLRLGLSLEQTPKLTSRAAPRPF